MYLLNSLRSSRALLVENRAIEEDHAYDDYNPQNTPNKPYLFIVLFVEKHILCSFRLSFRYCTI